MREESKGKYKNFIMGEHWELTYLAHYYDEFQDDNNGDPLLTDKGIDQTYQTGVMIKMFWRDGCNESENIFISIFRYYANCNVYSWWAECLISGN